MSVETRTTAPKEALHEQKPYAFVLTGASSKRARIGAIQKIIGSVETDGEAVHSIVFGGRPESDKYKSLGAKVKAKLESGRNVAIIAHSMGGPESCFLMEELNHTMGSDWLRQYNDKLHLAYISPTAPKNHREANTYLRRFLTRIVLQEGALVPIDVTLPNKNRFLRSAGSFVTFPPEDFAEHQALYTKTVRLASHGLSQSKGTVPELPYNPDMQRNYLHVLKPEKQEKIRKIDKTIRAVTEKHPDEKVLRKLLKKRAKITRATMNKIYTGKYAEQMGDTHIPQPKIERSHKARQLRNSVLKTTFWYTKIYNYLSKVAESGVQMTIVVPEFDALLNVEDAMQLAQGKENVSVYTAALGTHAYPYGTHAELFPALRDLPQTAITKDVYTTAA